MPALLPESVLAESRTPDIQEAVERGWELQVRGRVHQHLQQFITDYMEPDTHSKIYASPDKDYNVRFYTTREDYGNALKKMALAIDYTKFKDTARSYPWGKKYHDLLIRIWSASTSLAPAGGWYAPKTNSNPRGFSKRGSRRNSLYEPGERFDEDGYYMSPSRTSKSIHDLTDDDLEEMWKH